MASNYQQKMQERKLAEANAAGRERAQGIKQQKRYEDAVAEFWATPTAAQPGNVPPAVATTPPVYGPPKPPYVVKDGDTVETVASNFGTTTTNLLNSNPDVTAIVPGLVLNPPKVQGPPKPPGYGQGPAQGSEAWRVAQQNSGSMSYAANSQPFGPPKPAGYQGNNTPNPFSVQNNNAFSNYGQTSGPLSNNGQPGAQPGSEAWRTQNANTAGASQANNTPAWLQTNGYVNGQNPYNRYDATYEKDLVLEKFMQQAMQAQTVMGAGYFPDANIAKFLEQNGYIRPTKAAQPVPAYATYSKQLSEAKRRGGGGGGGGGVSAPRNGSANNYNNDGMPAFSGGGGMRGLVNWRL